MNQARLFPTRRSFLRGICLGTAFYTVPGAFAEELTRTPRQTEGPFYPDHLPLDTDNDLIVVNNSITPAVGQITWLSGRILDPHGDPVRNALVEIWQCDNNGAYLHTKTGQADKRDPHFQGFGRFLTGSTGEYVFRTIKPVPYPGRTPHVHFKIKKSGSELLTTQCYIEGHPGNSRDGVLNGIKNPKERKAVIIPFTPLRDSKIDEFEARFDVVLSTV